MTGIQNKLLCKKRSDPGIKEVLVSTINIITGDQDMHRFRIRPLEDIGSSDLYRGCIDTLPLLVITVVWSSMS